MKIANSTKTRYSETVLLLLFFFSSSSASPPISAPRGTLYRHGDFMKKYDDIRNLSDEDREDIWRFATERSEQIKVRGIEHLDLQTQRWEYEAQQEAKRGN